MLKPFDYVRRILMLSQNNYTYSLQSIWMKMEKVSYNNIQSIQSIKKRLYGVYVWFIRIITIILNCISFFDLQLKWGFDWLIAILL